MQHRPSILVVDDDSGSSMTLALIFGRKGYAVEAASTGQAALELARRKTFDIALLDIRLPDITGVTLIPSLKQLCPDMAVIIATGYASVDTAVKALDYGATAYFTKPLDMDAVLATVQEVVEKQRLVVEKRQAEVAMQRYIERLRTVRAIDGAILAGGTPEHITQVCLRFLRTVVPYDVGGTIVYDADWQRATFLDLGMGTDTPASAGTSFPLADLLDVEAAHLGAVHAEEDILHSDLPPHLVGELRELGVRSYLGAPLIAQNQVIGSFVLGRKEPGRFAPEHIDIVREVADQLAVGIQQANLREQVRRHTAELEQQVAARTAALARRQTQLQVAAEVARDASGGGDLQGLMTRAVELIRERFGFYHANIYLTDGPGEYAVLRAATGPAGQQTVAVDPKLPVEAIGLVGYVAATGKPRIANDVDSRGTPVSRSSLPDTRSEMALPLQTGERVIGVLDVQSTEAHAFGEDDVHILQVLADQLAVAIERIRLFEQIQATLEARLQMVISNLPIILFVVDCGGLLTLSEGKGLASVGLEPDEVVGRPVDEAFPDYAEFREHIHRALAGETFTAQVQLGDRVFESWYGALRNQDGDVTAVTTVCIDVTERQTLEAQIHRQERLAAVGQLAGGIAHDFNNFLTTIIMYASLLQRTPSLSDEGLPMVQVIIDESRRAAQLVRQVLDFSRRSMMKVEPVNLVSFIQEASEILGKTIPENIHLVTEIPPDEFIVNADPTRVQQVLMNLVLNARDAMPEGGEVRIRLAHIDGIPVAAEDSGAHHGPWTCLSIADTGTGMTEEVRSHIFEPFFTTKGQKGTGLGLAQVYGIVKQHGGEIDIETAVGRGTTFHIYLPAFHEEEAAVDVSHEPRPNLAQGQGETILLVEDESQVREAGRQVLEMLGYRVLVASDGHEGLRLYQSEEATARENDGRGVDLLITDMVMPGMGGKDLIHSAKATNPDLRVLALTGYMLQDDAESLRHEGLTGVITKPLDVDMLAQAVHRALHLEDT